MTMPWGLRPRFVVRFRSVHQVWRWLGRPPRARAGLIDRLAEELERYSGCE